MRIEDLENGVFTIINEQGEETECDVLVIFDSEETGKSYIIYTDNTVDEDGNAKVYASCFDPDSDDTELYPIDTDEEWEMVQAMVDSIQEELEEPEE